MFPFKKVLVPTDFSTSSQGAVDLAVALAKSQGAAIVLLHVDPPALSHGEEIDRRLPEYQQRLWNLLDGVAVALPGESVERVLDAGDPAQVIVATARDLNCDLIVIGTHGRGRLGKLLLGSVAEEVIRLSECPVVTVKATVAQPTS
jgi:nucleotide-binding universal stress UspA family protein